MHASSINSFRAGPQSRQTLRHVERIAGVPLMIAIAPARSANGYPRRMKKSIRNELSQKRNSFSASSSLPQAP